MRKYLATFAVALLAAFALGACGDDDKKDTVTGGTSATQDDSSDETSADDDSSDETSADDDSSDGGTFDTAKCTEIAQDMAAAAASATAGLGGSGDTDELDKSLDQFDAFADAAPDEISDDIKTLAEGYREYVEILIDSGFDPASGEPPSADAIEKLTEASEKFNDADFTAASERVSTWFEEECGQ